jgi:L-lactate dehydrogenase complex protein LldE
MVLTKKLKVSLFITCLVDQLCPHVGKSVVEVLRRAGCEVVFDERQTCCGQPAFNTGYRKEARKFAKRFIEIFEE